MTSPTRRPAPAPARPARLRRGCAAAALVAIAAPASAELTAQGVREEYFDLAERLGATVEVGSEDATEEAVTLEDVVIAVESDDPAGGAVRYAIPTMTFQAQDDGSVAVTIAPEIAIDATGTDPETGAETAFEALLRTEGYETVISEAGGPPVAEGEPEPEPGAASEAARRYDFEADRVVLDVVEAGPVDEPFEGDFELVMTDYTGSFISTPLPEATRYTGSTTIGEATVEATSPAAASGGDAGEAAGTGRGDVSVTMESVTLTGGFTVPDAAFAETQPEDPSALFDAGLAMEVALGFGPTDFSVDATGGEGGEENFSAQGEVGTAALSFSVDDESLTYDLTTEGTRVVIEGGGLPVPRAEVALGSTEGSFRIPTVATEGAEPFALRAMLSDLTLSEQIWAQFDPEGRLPRDPVSYSLAAEGQMRLLASLFDEAAQAEIEESDGEPFEIRQADLDLRVEGLGASVDADGSFTFDNDDLATFEGMPAPTGEATIEASGIDGLLDTLTDMGLVPSDQLMPARMVLGLFARSDGEGGYTSEVVVDGATGEITVNDQRLR